MAAQRRRLSFLAVGQGISGIGSGKGGSQTKPTAQQRLNAARKQSLGGILPTLDDECEDMFTTDSEKFSTARLTATEEPGIHVAKKELDLLQDQAHLKRGYRQVRAPLKTKRVERKRYLVPLNTDESCPAWKLPLNESDLPYQEEPYIIDMEKRSYKPSDDSEAQQSEASPATESPQQIKDRKFYFYSSDDGKDRGKVETDESEKEDDKFDETTMKAPKTLSRFAAQSRKYSLAEGPQFRRGRRVSVQPEDTCLPESDRADLDSRRSDDRPRRRSIAKTRKMSTVNINRHDQNQLADFFSGTSMKKTYDHTPHALFVQLDELNENNEEKEWKQTARWIKYEEDVEEGSTRWGKPHVASLSFHSLLNLRRCIQSGSLLLDLNEKDMAGIAFRITEQMAIDQLIDDNDKSTVMRTLLLRHKHVNEYQERTFRPFRRSSTYSSLQSLSDAEKGKLQIIPLKPNDKNEDVFKTEYIRRKSMATLDESVKLDMREETYTSQEEIKKISEDSILHRIPEGSEAASVLVGHLTFLEAPTIAFVRLAQGTPLTNVIEINIPIRFLFVLLGPSNSELDYHEVGRSISTLFSNKVFCETAYKADERKDILSAINEFLDDSLVLPPGNWDSESVLPFDELKSKSDKIRKKKEALRFINEIDDAKEALIVTTEAKEDKKLIEIDPLQKTGRVFGGLFNDIKRRFPYYWSDIKDGLNGQCFAAAIFMYFAALSSAITFGGLIADKTSNLMGISETLISTALTGIIFAILSGQPMMVVGTTGPLLLFDESLYKMCKSNNIDYLTLRVYLGFWLAVISMVVAMFEGSVLVKKFTRFTEDIFSSLISLIFIMEAVSKLLFVYTKHPLLSTYCLESVAAWTGINFGLPLMNNIETTPPSLNLTQESMDDNMLLLSNNSYWPSNYSDTPENIMSPEYTEEYQSQPNTALFSTLLTIGTFLIAYYLRIFRNSKFLGRGARRALGDFGVPIAIVTMVLLAYFIPQTYTDKLNVPEGLTPSDPETRGWIISLTGSEGKEFPIWAAFAAFVPALMVYIITFMETHIAELIVDKPERNLQKGSGFHMDIVLISFLNILCGLMGAPFVCVATVRSVSHVSALTIMSTDHAPGEKPYIKEVKEQRLSALIVSLLVGVSVLLASVLRLVPLSVLFGVFLYMGISSMNGIQLFERVILLFKPVKHYPPVPYVKKVKPMKIHLFTLIQVSCLTVLWVVKSSAASLAFPFLLILMVPLRGQLHHLFSPKELQALDGKQPELDLDDEPDFYVESTLPA